MIDKTVKKLIETDPEKARKATSQAESWGGGG
jgi:hypothetical protein